MPAFLVFQVYGPMQSWGAVAVGEIRSSLDRPTRSALLGLLAGALGVRRNEEERHQKLDRSFNLAIMPLSKGERMIDYHSSQCGKRLARRTFRVRSDEVGGLLGRDEDLPTILSRREYLTDAAFAVCVWLKPEAETPPWTLGDLSEALQRPRFVPYLGRKSCPPALPFQPWIDDFDTPEQALEAYASDRTDEKLEHLTRESSRSVFLPVEGEVRSGDYTMYDAPLSRVRRQFATRMEREIRLPEKSETEVDDVHE